MLQKTLFKSFNNNKTKEKKQTPKKKNIGKYISAIIVCHNKMENYNEYKKKETKNLKLKCLRTALHDGHG